MLVRPASDGRRYHDPIRHPFRHGAGLLPQRQPVRDRSGDPPVRTRALAELTILDPYLDKTVPLSVGLADRASMRLLHMVSGDPLRTPTVVSLERAECVGADGRRRQVSHQPGVRLDAWRHSARNCPDLARARRSGSQEGGIDDDTWTDHTDVRPTMLALLGTAGRLHPRRKGDRRAIGSRGLAGASSRRTPRAPISGWRLPTSSSTLRSASCRWRASNTRPPASRPRTPQSTTVICDKMADFTDRRDALADQINGGAEGACFR